MEVFRLPASAGVTWLRLGWQTLKANFVVLVAMQSFLLFVSLFSALIPVLNLVAALLGPLFTVGFYLALMRSDLQQTVKFTDLFVIFKHPQERLLLLRLGMIGLACALLVNFMGQPIIDALVNKQQILFGQTMALVMVMAIYLMAFCFAPMLIFFNRQHNLLQALTLSFKGCWRNALPLTVVGGVFMLLMMLSSILLMMPIIIIMPWLYAAMYHGYLAIYGVTVRTQMPERAPDSFWV